MADAAKELHRSRELGDAAGLPQNPYRWRVALARIRQSEGDLRGAIGMLDEAEVCYVGDYFPPVRPISAIRARLFVALGELDRAVGWGHERGLSADDDPRYLREFEHLTLVRALVATTARSVRRFRSTERTVFWTGCCGRRRRGSGQEACSRS